MWSSLDEVCGLPGSTTDISSGGRTSAHNRNGTFDMDEDPVPRFDIELQASDTGGVEVLPEHFPSFYPSKSRGAQDLVRTRSDDYRPSFAIESIGTKYWQSDDVSSTSMSSDATNDGGEKNRACLAAQSRLKKCFYAAAALSFVLIVAIAVSDGVKASDGGEKKSGDDSLVLDMDMGDSDDSDNIFVMDPPPPRVPILITQPVDGFASVSDYDVATTTGGGEGGEVVTVRDAASFEYYIKKKGPMIVQVDGLIDFSQNFAATNKTSYRVTADTTIVGIGPNSGIKGGGLKIQGYKICNGNDPDEVIGINCMGRNSTKTPTSASPESNIIIRNLRIEECPQDCIQITQFAHHVWIDHNSLSRPRDGLLDITRGSDLITVSWNRFSDAHKTMLLGHNDLNEDQDAGRLRVTYHHNYFFKSESRNPRARFGEPVHVYNNLYLSNGRYGLAAQSKSGMVVEGNFFDNVEVPITTDLSDNVGRVVERFNQYRNSDTRWQTGDLAEPDTYYEFSLFNTQLSLGVLSAGDFGSGDVIEPFQFYTYRLDDPIVLPELIPQYAGTGRIARI